MPTSFLYLPNLKRSLRRPSARWIVLILAAGFLLLVGWLINGWYQGTPFVQSQMLNAARAQWRVQPPMPYEARIDVAISPEALPPLINLADQRLQSVEGHFDLIEHYGGTLAFRCGGLNFECAMPVQYQAQAQYDSEMGYPHEIILTRTEHPDWFNPEFWHWFWDEEIWQKCRNMFCTESVTMHIELHLEPAE